MNITLFLPPLPARRAGRCFASGYGPRLSPLSAGDHACPPARSTASNSAAAWFAPAPICLSAKTFRSGWGWDLWSWASSAARSPGPTRCRSLTFAILFATALVDVVLYLIVPDALMCYRCGAQYRMAEGMARHGAFNLETHERYRQQAARMAGHAAAERADASRAAFAARSANRRLSRRP